MRKEQTWSLAGDVAGLLPHLQILGARRHIVPWWNLFINSSEFIQFITAEFHLKILQTAVADQFPVDELAELQPLRRRFRPCLGEPPEQLTASDTVGVFVNATRS